jgi:threonyl-tRNA synthetase
MEVSSHHSLAPLNQTAAILIGAAVTELFPGALIVGGQGTPERFFCDFAFPFEFQPDFLNLIEERMRLIIREKREVRLLEMMPSNAASMMRHRGQPLAADALLDVQRAVVEMCQIGEFAAYSPFPFLQELTIPFFKLLEGFPLGIAGKKVIRIVGAATLEKDVLKAISKELPLSSRSHLTLSQEMEMLKPLSEEGFWLWLPKGEALRQSLIRLWEEEHIKQNFHFVSSPAAFIGDGGEGSVTWAHREYFFCSSAKRIAEIALLSSPHNSDPSLGLLSPKAYFVDRAHLFCPDEKLLEECISSLHFICKIPKILGFEFEIVLSVSSEGSQRARSKGLTLFRQALDRTGIAYTVEKDYRVGILTSIDVRIADALGRRWTGPFLSIPEAAMPVGKGSMLIRSAFGSLERMVALLLEKNMGWLPLCLAPEQVRVLVATGKSGSYARQVCEGLRSQGFRAAIEGSEGALKARLYKAIEEKVPYVILLGEREERARTLTLRAHGESKEQSLSLDEFCMRLKSELRSETSELTN